MIVKNASGQNYEIFNWDKLYADVARANAAIGDGVTVSRRLEMNGLTDSTINNAKHNLERNKRKNVIDVNELEPCDIYGMLQPGTLLLVCAIWGLNKSDYNIGYKKKEEPVVEEVVTPPTAYLSEVMDKLDELISAINKLGNIQMQSLEYQQTTMNYSQTTAQQTKLLNDKFNKPSAYRPHH